MREPFPDQQQACALATRSEYQDSDSVDGDVGGGIQDAFKLINSIDMRGENTDRARHT